MGLLQENCTALSGPGYQTTSALDPGNRGALVDALYAEGGQPGLLCSYSPVTQEICT